MSDNREFVSELDKVLSSYADYREYKRAYLEDSPNTSNKVLQRYKAKSDELRNEFIKKFAP